MTQRQSFMGQHQLKGCHLLTGVWDVSNVLEATFQKGDFEPHTLSIEVEDVPGVLNQVSSAAYAVSGSSSGHLLNCSISRSCRSAYPAALPGRIALHSCTPA